MSATTTTTATASSWSPPSGWVGNLSAEQQKALDEFRALLKTENLFPEDRGNDATLLRFLRARKFDVKLARDMWAASEKWRKDYGTDDLFKNGFEFPERPEVDKYYPQYYHKTDKEGRPIYIEQLGPLDVNALYKVTTEERQLRRLVWEYERLLRKRIPACADAAGHAVEASCTILDLKGVGIGQFWKVKDYIAQSSHIGQNYYPEIMGRFYIINANLLFSTIWSVIKGWLDKATVEKIIILDSGYKEKLLEGISAENLPVEFQGECKCEGGCSQSDAGPWKR